jgi:hypothetical protein
MRVHARKPLGRGTGQLSGSYVPTGLHFTKAHVTHPELKWVHARKPLGRGTGQLSGSYVPTGLHFTKAHVTHPELKYKIP